MHLLVRPIFISLVCCVASTAIKAMELTKYLQVFGGPHGREVVLAPRTDGTQTLVRVSDVNHLSIKWFSEHGGAPRHCAKSIQPGLMAASMGLLHKQASRYCGSDEYVPYLPSRRDGVQVGFNGKSSKSFKLADLQASYAQQHN